MGEESITDKKIGTASVGEWFAIGVSKSVTERLMLPVVGNASWRSAIVKGLAAGTIALTTRKVQKYGINRIGGVVAGGLAVDTVEDSIMAFMDLMGAGAKAPSNTI